MSTTALQICSEAYRLAQLDQELTSFATNQVFPYNNALSLIQDVVREMNRLGNFSKMFTTNSLTFASGVFQYTLTSQSPKIIPGNIISVYRDLDGERGDLSPYNWQHFRNKWRVNSVEEGKPTAWACKAQTLELNLKPDKDYELKVEHYRYIPKPTATSDTFFPWPEEDEDVLIQGVHAMLLQRMGRPDFQENYELFITKARRLLADEKKDAAKPLQLPANF